MLALALIIWGLIAIGTAYQYWWILALVLVIFLPRGVDKLVLYIWAAIALAHIPVAVGWVIAYACLAAVDILTDD